ncbi:MAG TPA: hypothetical protein PLN21_03145 [Gemmatales bacterium]|nr:hypothetical protein [Gemmatales bacterium]
MASSELSSSEINQGQGFYHDGKNEASGVPALQTPGSPSRILLEAEEGMWEKYSSHYEFPLSLVIALGIHVIVILLVVAFMTLTFYWSPSKPPVMEVFENEPPRIQQEGEGQVQREGGSNGDQGRDPLAPLFDPLKLTTPKPLEIPNEFPSPLPVFPTDEPRQRPRAPGTRDGGIGDTGGPGIGNKPGSGVPMARNMRWRILFNYNEPEVFVGQLANLQVTVAVRLNNGRFMVYKNLPATSPFNYEEMTDGAFMAYVNEARRLWFINHDRTTCENFAYAVNLSERPLTLVMVIPAEMEQAILAAELQYHKMTEDEIRAKRLLTSFKVIREGSHWKVTVTKSEVLK